MTSKSEIKRQVVQRGGTMDDAQKAIDITEQVKHALRITRVGDDEPLSLFPIGDFTVAHLRNGKIYIRYKTGEGGEFSAELLEAVIYKLFWENF